jgi:molybdopterin-guanine dinucleotide biosynthesis protein A
MRLAALVLAGGTARRLGGGDKPLLDLGGQPMLARVLAALAPEAANVAISANGDPGRFAAVGLPVLPDGFPDQGPLAGVLAGLEWAAGQAADALLTAPGDTPFLPSGLAAALAPPPACAASAGRIHHLVALWPLAVRARLRETLSCAGPRDVGLFAAAIGMRVVAFPAVPFDPFMNVNTQADLAAARRIVAESG